MKKGVDKQKGAWYTITRRKENSDAVNEKAALKGSIAQLGEHLPYKQRVIGSSPIVPTIWPGSSVG